MSIGISGLGTYAPKKIVTNDDLSKLVDTNDEWIYSRTGIRQRHVAEGEEDTLYMALEASKVAIQDANINPQDIDFIICSTVTREYAFPSVAALVQKALEIPSIPAFDMGPACGGFAYVLATAESYVKSGLAKKVLCICSEKLSDIIDWTDRNTCVLFGDAAGAVIIEENPSQATILKTIIGGDGAYGELLRMEKIGDKPPVVRMDGMGVFKSAIRIMDEQVREVCASAGKTIEDIDLLIPHQANARIMSAVAERLGIPVEKTYMNVAHYGNTSSVSVLLALADAKKEGILKEGMLVACPVLGAGFTWGASLLQY